MIPVTEIERMTVDERLQTMELLWDSLTRRPEDVPSPAWPGEVLAERMAKLERGEGEFLTLAEVQTRLNQPAP